jgi:hypothetical protein
MGVSSGRSESPLVTKQVNAIPHLGWYEFVTVPAEDQAIRLSLCNAESGLWHGRLGRVIWRRRIDEANVWLEKARSPVPAALLTRSRLAASYAHGRETNLPPPNLPKPED